jgi:uncharacterized protein
MLNDSKTLTTALGLAIGFALAGFFIGAGLKEIRKPKQAISVKGLAEQMVKSDAAKLELSYSVAVGTVADFSRAVDVAQREIQSYLTAQGFKPENIQLGDVRMTDVLANSYGDRKLTGPRFVGGGSVFLNSSEVDKVEKAKQESSGLLAKGVQLSGAALKFFFTDLNSIKGQMLTDATTNARKAAESFAVNAGVRLGPLLSASQGSFEILEPLQSSSVRSYDEGSAVSSVMKKVRVVINAEFETP